MNNSFLENEFATLETAEDIARIFSNIDPFLADKYSERILKLSLQIIGRNDLATKLEIYVAASK